ncbi:hypothetical protein C8F01DRAFT_1253957 [Mycena amicta]|nr:hypothetical protein C8F01DRAFT_1253957 [Mycena amicta]
MLSPTNRPGELLWLATSPLAAVVLQRDLSSHPRVHLLRSKRPNAKSIRLLCISRCLSDLAKDRHVSDLALQTPALSSVPSSKTPWVVTRTMQCRMLEATPRRRQCLCSSHLHHPNSKSSRHSHSDTAYTWGPSSHPPPLPSASVSADDDQMMADDNEGVPVARKENDTDTDRMPGLGTGCMSPADDPARAQHRNPPSLSTHLNTNTDTLPTVTPAPAPAFPAVRRRCQKLRSPPSALHSVHPLRARNRRIPARAWGDFFVCVAGLIIIDDDNAYTNGTWSSVSSIPLA